MPSTCLRSDSATSPAPARSARSSGVRSRRQQPPRAVHVPACMVQRRVVHRVRCAHVRVRAGVDQQLHGRGVLRGHPVQGCAPADGVRVAAPVQQQFQAGRHLVPPGGAEDRPVRDFRAVFDEETAGFGVVPARGAGEGVVGVRIGAGLKQQPQGVVAAHRDGEVDGRPAVPEPLVSPGRVGPRAGSACRSALSRASAPRARSRSVNPARTSIQGVAVAPYSTSRSTRSVRPWLAACRRAPVP